jgi:hypothetical protein
MSKMIRLDGTIITAGDVVMYFASLLLAFTSAAFAAYFILIAPQTNGRGAIEIQPSYSNRTVLADAVDPIVTGSISRTTRLDSSIYEIPGSPDQFRNTMHYKIRVQREDLAYVDFDSEYLTYTLVVRVGDTVPGIGKVRQFENRNGNWYLLTAAGATAAEGFVKAN